MSMKRPEHHAIDPDSIVDRFVDYLVVEKGLAKNTIASYSADLARYLRFLRTTGITHFSESDTPVILRHLIALRDQGLGPRSRARHLVTIRGLYGFLVRENVLSHNPAQLVDLPKIGRKLPQTLHVDEVVRLLGAPDAKSPAGLRDRSMLELLYGAGLRVSEIVRLGIADVNLEACFVRVLGKGSKERMVPFGKKAQQKLDMYLISSRPVLLKGRPSDYLFVTRLARPMTRQGFWKILKQAAQKAGIRKPVTPRADLRSV